MAKKVIVSKLSTFDGHPVFEPKCINPNREMAQDVDTPNSSVERLLHQIDIPYILEALVKK